MSLAKLKKLHIIIIGATLCVIAGTAMFFLLIKPLREQYHKADERYKAASVLGNQAAEDQAIRDRDAAIVKVNLAQREMDAQMQRRMPDLSFARRDLGMLALWREQIGTLGPLLQRFAHNDTIAAVDANFSIPPPPASPNDPVFDQDVLVFQLGAVQAHGNFKVVMQNIRRWNNCERLVMVSSPSLSGTSPNLTASYSLTCYIFPAVKGGQKEPIWGGAQVAQQ